MGSSFKSTSFLITITTTVDQTKIHVRQDEEVGDLVVCREELVVVAKAFVVFDANSGVYGDFVFRFFFFVFFSSFVNSFRRFFFFLFLFDSN